MSFESGSVGFRIFYLPKPLPSDVVQRFAENAAPPLETLTDNPIQGWVTGRHLLDRNITDDTAYYAGFLRMTLMKAERKIPNSLLVAECKMEELAHMQAEGKEKLSARVKREIRDSITERLLPDMPPQLKGISVIVDEHNSLVYASALSEAQLDSFVAYFSATTGVNVIPLDPDATAIHRTQSNVRDWTPVSFSKDVPEEKVGFDPGEDFLTWLWFVSEARGGIVDLEQSGKFAVMVDGPLHLGMEGDGAFEAVIRRGEPRFSAEAKAALLSGKKLRKAKLTLARDDDHIWVTALDGSTFTFRGLKLPDGEKLDAVSKFQERMMYIDQFREAFFGLYDRFCQERQDSQVWTATVEDIQEWVQKRKTRN